MIPLQGGRVGGCVCGWVDTPDVVRQPTTSHGSR